MDALARWCPSPGEGVPWRQLDTELAWVRRMRGVPQDPVHHAEGDVWIHTRMVLEALVELPAWQELPERARQIVFAAALLHDVAKPWTTRSEPDGSVTARGHSAAGTVASRELLWDLDVAPAAREQVCALVARHQLPFFAVESPSGERQAVLASCAAPNRWLALVNEADGLGRRCGDPGRLADNVALFRCLCEELGCLDEAYAFANPTARFRFARSRGTRHDVPPEHFRTQAIVMCGLPGAGKDHWIANHCPSMPMVSLDRIRQRMKVDPRDKQGPVAAAGREEARVHLRAQRPFVWNATNVTKQHRDRIIDLCVDYGARVTLVHVEAPRDQLMIQNEARADPVPRGVISSLTRRWQVPEPSEAHEVRYITQ